MHAANAPGPHDPEHQGDTVTVTAQEPGAALLDELLTALGRFVVFPSAEAADAVVLWIAATYAQDVLDAAPRLNFTGPEKRCGKSRALDMIEATCHAPLVTADASVAAIFRSIGPNPPTLIFDEVDAVFGTKAKSEVNEDLRALLNAGFQRNRPARRCVGPQQEVREFPTFAMAALAGIGELPGTILDRSVVVRMRRRAPGEAVSPYRFSRDRAPLRALGDRLGAWVRTVKPELRHAEPVLPVEDRAADLWEPLVILADAAGGTWPERARVAAVALTAEGAESSSEASLGVRLLADCREVFATGIEEIGSEELCNKLRALPEAPWESFTFTQRNLAKRLRPYGIAPRQVRPGGMAQVRGYRASDFHDAFSRYLSDQITAPAAHNEAGHGGAAPTPELILDGSAGVASQTVTPSHSQLTPVTLPERVTDGSVTRPSARSAGDASRLAPRGTGLEASPAHARDPSPDAQNGGVTDRSVTPIRTVTGLTCASDGVTVCDSNPTRHRTCPECGHPMDRIYHEAGAHPWCQSAPAGALFEHSKPGTADRSASAGEDAARHARPHP